MSRNPAKPIVDSLLREVLAGKSPPDLTDRVLRAVEEADEQQLQALRDESYADEILSGGDLSEHGQRAARLIEQARAAKDARQALPASSLDKAISDRATNAAETTSQETPSVKAASRSGRLHRKSRSQVARRRTDWVSPVFWMSCGAACLTLVVAIGTLVMRSLNPDTLDSHSGTFDFWPSGSSNQIVERDLSGDSKTTDQESQSDQIASNSDNASRESASNGQPLPEFGAGSNNRLNQLIVADRQPPEPAIPDTELVHFINRSIKEEMEPYVMPAAIIEDDQWQQRVTEILLGRPANDQEQFEFKELPSKDRRNEYVDLLLYSDEYADELSVYWAHQLAEHLETNKLATGSDFDQQAKQSLLNFLQQRIHDRVSLDSIVAELLTASGSPQPAAENFNAATGYLALATDPGNHEALTGRVARTFLGQRLDCVQCHDHPVAQEWTQDKFWQLNSYFRQLQIEQIGAGTTQLVDRDYVGDLNQREDAVFFYENSARESVAVTPQFNQHSISSDGRVDQVNRRFELARALVDSSEFRSNFVNRIWSDCFQVGLVRPLDELGSHNSVAHQTLLQNLAEQFASHDYQLRPLLKWMVLSDPFRRAEGQLWEFAIDVPHLGRQQFFSRYYSGWSKPNSALEALTTVADGRSILDDYGVGITGIFASRSITPSNASDSNPDVSSDPAEQLDPNLVNAFALRSADNPWGTLGADYAKMLDQLAQGNLPLAEKIDHLFQLAIGRHPTAAEMERARQIVAFPASKSTQSSAANLVDPDAELKGLRDLWWALRLSQEFDD